MKKQATRTDELLELFFEDQELDIINMDPSGHFMAPCGCKGWITPIKDSRTSATWGFILSTKCPKMVQLNVGQPHNVGIDFDDNPCDAIYWSFVYSHEDLDTSSW